MKDTNMRAKAENLFKEMKIFSVAKLDDEDSTLIEHLTAIVLAPNGDAAIRLTKERYTDTRSSQLIAIEFTDALSYELIAEDGLTPGQALQFYMNEDVRFKARRQRKMKKRRERISLAKANEKFHVEQAAENSKKSRPQITKKMQREIERSIEDDVEYDVEADEAPKVVKTKALTVKKKDKKAASKPTVRRIGYKTKGSKVKRRA